MPPRRRIVTRKRRFSLDSLGGLELQRWGLGGPLIEGKWTPSPLEQEGPYPRVVWASWAELFETYELLRDEYLAYYEDRRRHLNPVPHIELLYQAWRRGEDPADVVLPIPPDPRRLLGVS
ncbi:MAG TPA: hypothetical protein VJB57_04110 [Dehalococcoidia bacterium]|nr:hypothetical protein [Dehalococcoidia bacterium]